MLYDMKIKIVNLFIGMHFFCIQMRLLYRDICRIKNNCIFYISREIRDPECVRFFWIPQRNARYLVISVSLLALLPTYSQTE